VAAKTTTDEVIDAVRAKAMKPLRLRGGERDDGHGGRRRRRLP